MYNIPRGKKECRMYTGNITMQNGNMYICAYNQMRCSYATSTMNKNLNTICIFF